MSVLCHLINSLCFVPLILWNHPFICATFQLPNIMVCTYQNFDILYQLIIYDNNRSRYLDLSISYSVGEKTFILKKQKLSLSRLFFMD